MYFYHICLKFPNALKYGFNPLRSKLDDENNAFTVLESDINDDETVPFPVRPKWDYNMTAEQVELNEKEYFDKWLLDIKNSFSPERLNYFESNLETWRQLWRVCERSDFITNY